MAIRWIKKRDGRIVPFEPEKIKKAILKAFAATGQKDGKLAQKLTERVVARLQAKFKRKIPSVEDVQNLVEEELIKANLTAVAKAYILYRRRRTEIRELKKFFGVVDDLKIGINAVYVLKRRYLLRDESGNILETPKQMMTRVAKAIARAEKRSERASWRTKFFDMLCARDFLPNSPTLMNAGTALGQLSACFVLPVGDSIPEIFDAVKQMAIIHQSGGGTGFTFTHLRPKGDIVHSTMGQASGPVSFMRVFDVATDVVKQGGKRRGANMGILNYNHPDIVEFVTAKSHQKILNNFNISVGVEDKFMRALERGKDIALINPRTGKESGRMPARQLFELIVHSAWLSGDPGLIFFDTINRAHPLPEKIEATNPCGEQPLLPYESCNLGSINLAHLVRAREIDWERLRELVWLGVRFLDDVITVNKFPLPQIREKTLASRKIGLGIMGWAEMLFLLEIPYNSKNALKLAEKLMAFISRESHAASEQLGQERGSFPLFESSKWAKKYSAMRNATTTTIAPTGSISIIAGCSSGIEPLFAISFVRNILEGARLIETNKIFERVARERRFYSRELMLKIAKVGSIQNIKGIPNSIKRIFVTALDIAPEWHVKMQAAFQKYTDNAVSKTVNLPQNASPEDIAKIYKLAWALKCKGITVYRYGSKPEQVLYLGAERHVAAGPEYAGGCPATICTF